MHTQLHAGRKGPELHQPDPEHVTVNTLFSSDLYCINDFTCYSGGRRVFKPAFTPTFCINISRKGYFTFHSFRQVQEEFNSRILVEKPGCEFLLKQQQPGLGACTVIRFTHHAYEAIREKYKLRDISFFLNENIFSHILVATPETDYYHDAILKSLASNCAPALELDSLVLDLLDAVMQLLTGQSPPVTISESTKRNHLSTIERAKEFMLENFSTDISLQQLARHCFVSPFHFCRLFKLFCGYTPFQYLQHLRLKHAETLISTTDLPVTDVCFRSGFNRLDYFSAAFAKKYSLSPSKYKSGAMNKKPAMPPSGNLL